MIEVKESIVIKTTPEKIWNFLISLHQKDTYKKWHQKDHIILKILKGNGADIGSIFYAEEYIGKRILRLKYKLVKAEYPFYLEYKPIFPSSIFANGIGSFKMEPIDNLQTKFIAYIKVGLKPKIIDWLWCKIITVFFKEEDLVKHVKEEGENTRKVLENQE